MNKYQKNFFNSPSQATYIKRGDLIKKTEKLNFNERISITFGFVINADRLKTTIEWYSPTVLVAADLPSPEIFPLFDKQSLSFSSPPHPKSSSSEDNDDVLKGEPIEPETETTKKMKTLGGYLYQILNQTSNNAQEKLRLNYTSPILVDSKNIKYRIISSLNNDIDNRDRE